MPDDPFTDDLVRWPWTAAGGLLVPVRFPSLEAVAVVGTGATAALKAQLPDPRLRPVEVGAGRSLVQFVAVSYRDSELGAYDELAVTVPVAWGGAPLPALDAAMHGLSRTFSGWIWHMPVTTVRARDAGRDLAGFPKVLGDLRFASSGEAVDVVLSSEGRLAVHLALPAPASPTPPALRARTLRLRSYTQLQGRTVVSNLLVRETRWRDLPRPRGTTLELGEGALAESLRALDLGAAPWFAHHAVEAQALLFPPRNPADD